MRKTILTFGLIAGIIVTSMMVFSTYQLFTIKEKFEPNAIIGYSGMLVAFSFVFLGIRHYREKHNGGIITFEKAFTIGLLIAFIASLFYVVGWLVEYYYFFPDFMDRYIDFVLIQAKSEGQTVEEIQAKLKEMEMYKEWYKNPVLLILLTIAEILPLGIIVGLISALILKRNQELPKCNEPYEDITA